VTHHETSIHGCRIWHLVNAGLPLQPNVAMPGDVPKNTVDRNGQGGQCRELAGATSGRSRVVGARSASQPGLRMTMLGPPSPRRDVRVTAITR
jgi:hypothetical protein